MPDPTSVAKTVIDAGGLAWEHRGTLSKALATLRRWFRRDSHVLIIGPGGTGKTTLSRILSDEFDWLADSPWNYDESISPERIRIRNRNVEVVVAPGQKARRNTTWTAVKAEIAAGKYRGIVFVSAFGYHTVSGGVALATIKPGKKKDDALAEHLAECRADEVAVLRGLCETMKLSPKKLWLLSLVTKQDLWVADEPAVRAHYEHGEYAEVVRELATARGEQLFRHEFAFACLVISNWIAGRGERLAKNAEGYDHQSQVTSVRSVFDLLDGLRRWEK